MFFCVVQGSTLKCNLSLVLFLRKHSLLFCFSLRTPMCGVPRDAGLGLQPSVPGLENQAPPSAFYKGCWENSGGAGLCDCETTRLEMSPSRVGKTERPRKELAMDSCEVERWEEASSSRRFSLFLLSENGELEKHSVRVAGEESWLRPRHSQGACSECFHSPYLSSQQDECCVGGPRKNCGGKKLGSG